MILTIPLFGRKVRIIKAFVDIGEGENGLNNFILGKEVQQRTEELFVKEVDEYIRVIQQRRLK